jgi:hypothetical protein
LENVEGKVAGSAWAFVLEARSVARSNRMAAPDSANQTTIRLTPSDATQRATGAAIQTLVQ